MIPLIVAKYGGKHVAKKSAKAMVVLKVGIGGVLATVSTLIVAFASSPAEAPDTVVVSMQGEIPLVQSSAAASYVQRFSQDAATAGHTNINLSNAYVDAQGTVPAYSTGKVSTQSDVVIGINSPTLAYTDNAFVVNLIPLMDAEMQDLIDFEAQYLHVSGHKTAREYTLGQLSVNAAVMGNNGYTYSSSGGASGGVGPAILIRDFYAKNLQGEWNAHNWEAVGGHYGEGYIDAMWVANKDLDAYIAGSSVDVKYMQIDLVDCKGHTAPWGVNQTYFYMNYTTDQMQPQHDSGSPATRCVGGVDMLSKDEPTALAALLDVAKKNENGSGVYTWPTLKATSKDLGMKFKTEPSNFSVPAQTWCVLECGAASKANASIPVLFKDHTLVGFLVYTV